MTQPHHQMDKILPESGSDSDGLIKTAGKAGFARAVQPIQAQTHILTSDKGLTAGWDRINTASGELPVYYAKPACGSGSPVVLVVQEIFGVHEHIQDICRRLAGLGYFVLAPELFFRQGDPGKIDNITDILQNIVAKVLDAQVFADLDVCIQWAEQQGGDILRLGITGFCWGGRIVWLYAAHNACLKAAVAWYGRLTGHRDSITPENPIDIVSRLKAPVLGLYGGSDTGILPGDIENMQIALKDADSHSRIIVYPDMPHAFFADYRPTYRKLAAEDGWEKLKSWFMQHLR